METVVCYDADTGREVWAREIEGRLDDPLGGPGPRATPTLADGGLYVTGATGWFMRLNPLTYEGTLWYLLPDVIAAVLLSGGGVPTVSRAIRLRPVILFGCADRGSEGEQALLCSVDSQLAAIDCDPSPTKLFSDRQRRSRSRSPPGRPR